MSGVECPQVAELRRLLEAISASDVPRLADVREACRLRHASGFPDAPAFFALRAAACDLDTVPDESRRDLYADEFLTVKARECDDYMRAASLELKEGANTLLGMLASHDIAFQALLTGQSADR